MVPMTSSNTPTDEHHLAMYSIRVTHLAYNLSSAPYYTPFFSYNSTRARTTGLVDLGLERQSTTVVLSHSPSISW